MLAISESDLPLLTRVVMTGGLTAAAIGEAVGQPHLVVRERISRLAHAGYVQEERGRVVVTEHARRWIESIWGPLEREGSALLGRMRTAELVAVARFLQAACTIQEGHLARVCASLVSSRSSRPSRSRRGGLSPAARRRVEAFVEAHLAEEIRLDALAERAGLSRFHFARSFKSTTGVTPRVYVEIRRIARATQLLGETELPLAQVALDCGFASQSRLTTIFRRRTGQTPARYRASTRSAS